ncbi:MAG: hypothetical protein JWN66_3724 [Sphingomonas bacterium]|uniref:YopX family protein n=1 Tax=Sphingomonas bacterium TaxID=1895847 RepID=UPI0026182E7B|nr:YopX family protein [Sphingomonas bacterium]MDB5706608.1 hypothetical protein [Sphingomonas bacterium]
MNRVIKFRAWDSANAKMVAQSYLDCHKRGFRILESDEFTFMQFTGLLDKNGNEIYEGDVIEFLSRRGPVEWDKTGQLAVRFPHESGFNWRIAGHNTSDMAVIGNIYENPELLP